MMISFLKRPILSMQSDHAEISVYGDKVTLRPLTDAGRVLINGVEIEPHVETNLQPNDRLVFGATQLWLFRFPELEHEAGVSDSPMINYDFVLNEMAAKSGLDILSSSSDGKVIDKRDDKLRHNVIFTFVF